MRLKDWCTKGRVLRTLVIPNGCIKGPEAGWSCIGNIEQGELPGLDAHAGGWAARDMQTGSRQPQ